MLTHKIFPEVEDIRILLAYLKLAYYVLLTQFDVIVSKSRKQVGGFEQTPGLVPPLPPGPLSADQSDCPTRSAGKERN